jgi:hypothetical protein
MRCIEIWTTETLRNRQRRMWCVTERGDELLDAMTPTLRIRLNSENRVGEGRLEGRRCEIREGATVGSMRLNRSTASSVCNRLKEATPLQEGTVRMKECRGAQARTTASEMLDVEIRQNRSCCTC